MKRGIAFFIFVTLIVGSTNLSLRDALTSLSLLLFSSVAFAIPARAGYFNLGIHAQFIAGALAAVTVMQHWRHSPWIAALLALPLAGLAGAIVGAIPLLLRVYGKIHEVISSILLNGLMLTVASYVLRFGVDHTYTREQSVMLVEFQQFDQVSMFVGAVSIIVSYVMFRRSFLWIMASAQGESPSILQYSGFRPSPYMWLWVTVAATIAGCGAALRVLDEQGKFTNLEFASVGFSGIVGAMLFGDSPLGVISACVVLAILEALRLTFQIQHGIPIELVTALEACALILLLLRKQRQEESTQ